VMVGVPDLGCVVSLLAVYGRVEECSSCANSISIEI
jgi:hypothetical protein